MYHDSHPFASWFYSHCKEDIPALEYAAALLMRIVEFTTDWESGQFDYSQIYFARELRTSRAKIQRLQTVLEQNGWIVTFGRGRYGVRGSICRWPAFSEWLNRRSRAAPDEAPVPSGPTSTSSSENRISGPVPSGPTTSETRSGGPVPSGPSASKMRHLISSASDLRHLTPSASDLRHITPSSASTSASNSRHDRRDLLFDDVVVVDASGQNRQPARTVADGHPILELYRRHLDGPVVPAVLDTLAEIIESYPWDWIELAFDLASANGARGVSYVVKTLRSWRAAGRILTKKEVSRKNVSGNRDNRPPPPPADAEPARRRHISELTLDE